MSGTIWTDIPTTTRVAAVVRRPTHTMGLENAGGSTLVHCTVHTPWTRSVAASVRRDIDRITEMHGGPLFTVKADTDPRSVKTHAKFCRLNGFEFHKTILCTDGVERPVYIRWR